MGSSGIGNFLKRALPFFAAFALSLLIASFFVDLSRPGFRGGKARKCRDAVRLRVENEELRGELQRLREELRMAESLPLRPKHQRHPRHGEGELGDLEMLVPPPAPVAPRTER